MMQHSFPDNYGEECIIIVIDKALVPLVGGALKPFEQSYSWVTDADYEQGYNAFAQLQASMANNCLEELIESNRQIYRLLDAGLNGQTYTTAPDPLDPTKEIALPAIPVAPAAFSSATALAAQSLRSLVPEERTRELAEIDRAEARRLLLVAIDAKLAQLLASETSDDLQEIIGQLAAILAIL